MLAVIVLTVAGMAFHFAASGSAIPGVGGLTGAASPALRPSAPGLEHDSASAGRSAAHPVSAASLSFPLFFEPNVGQTDGRVKFLARGSGYGLFLTADEAVLSLQHRAAKGQMVKSDVVRMHLDGASSTSRIRGAEPLPGKSNYFIGNDPSKWRRGISQFARVEYQRVYPGVDLVYYGNQKQLEYDFRVAPGADPNQIALSFQGASARLDSGDLVLSTADGDIRFHAPHIYQPAAQTTARASAATSATISGGFRQLADNKIGFTVGHYDPSRELVIDPVLSYSTYLGMGGESLVSEAIDFANNIYVAGSTTSPNFPTTAGAIQTTLNGTQNIFVAVLNPLAGSGSAQLLFATYLGGSGIDQLGGVAVDPGNSALPDINIYVAGTTTSPDFPITMANAFQATATFTGSQTHGFLSAINASNVSGSNVFTLTYSTYLAGNAGSGISGNDTTENDVVTGLAVDSFFDAYVTGTTTSTDILTGFPSTTNGYQICPWQPAQSGGTPCPITSGPTQFFASEINTAGSGAASMLYSTYFGGGYPCPTCTPAPVAIGGGIAVDVIPNNPRSNVNMYFTGTTNMWGGGAPIPNGAAPFPLVNAWQSCLNQSGVTSCMGVIPTAYTDAFIVKLNPNQIGAIPSYSTYLGGEFDDKGAAVAVDNIGDSYVTGSTNSPDWNCTNNNACAFAPNYGAYDNNGDAFIAKVANYQGGIFPLVFFAYIGGSGKDDGNAIAVDSVQSAHIAGTTTSTDLPVVNASQAGYGGGASDAFVALMSSTVLTGTTGNYVTYLGGNFLDQGTGIVLDNNGTAYVAGVTRSSNFPAVN
ncbi:MAG: SBBP repeat-containing protein, partial [Terriglobales bacterium]